MSKRKKPTRSKLVKKLDILFSQFVRVSNADKNGYCTCVTCGKKGHWKDGSIQAGHFMSRKHYNTRWDIRNVKPQCIACNLFKSGEQYKYSIYLGLELSKELYLQSNKIVKFSNDELQQMIDRYSLELKRLV
jgi:hypothetical protein